LANPDTAIIQQAVRRIEMVVRSLISIFHHNERGLSLHNDLPLEIKPSPHLVNDLQLSFVRLAREVKAVEDKVE
jgi:hypothetical protein